MGKLPPGLKEAMSEMKGHSYGGRNTTDQVEHLTKLVHILWRQVEKLESIIHVTSGGLHIKSDAAEILVRKDGHIVIKGTGVRIKTLERDEQF